MRLKIIRAALGAVTIGLSQTDAAPTASSTSRPRLITREAQPCFAQLTSSPPRPTAGTAAADFDNYAANGYSLCRVLPRPTPTSLDRAYYTKPLVTPTVLVSQMYCAEEFCFDPVEMKAVWHEKTRFAKLGRIECEAVATGGEVEERYGYPTGPFTWEETYPDTWKTSVTKTREGSLVSPTLTGRQVNSYRTGPQPRWCNEERCLLQGEEIIAADSPTEDYTEFFPSAASAPTSFLKKLAPRKVTPKVDGFPRPFAIGAGPCLYADDEDYWHAKESLSSAHGKVFNKHSICTDGNGGTLRGLPPYTSTLEPSEATASPELEPRFKYSTITKVDPFPTPISSGPGGCLYVDDIEYWRKKEEFDGKHQIVAAVPRLCVDGEGRLIRGVPPTTYVGSFPSVDSKSATPIPSSRVEPVRRLSLDFSHRGENGCVYADDDEEVARKRRWCARHPLKTDRTQFCKNEDGRGLSSSPDWKEVFSSRYEYWATKRPDRPFTIPTLTTPISQTSPTSSTLFNAASEPTSIQDRLAPYGCEFGIRGSCGPRGCIYAEDKKTLRQWKGLCDRNGFVCCEQPPVCRNEDGSTTRMPINGTSTSEGASTIASTGTIPRQLPTNTTLFRKEVLGAPPRNLPPKVRLHDLIGQKFHEGLPSRTPGKDKVIEDVASDVDEAEAKKSAELKAYMDLRHRVIGTGTIGQWAEWEKATATATA